MTYVAREAREELLETVAEAIGELGMAVAALGAAHELLDDASAERLERELFRPVQLAFGRARRAHVGFAARHGLPSREVTSATPGPASQGARGFVDRAMDAVAETDSILSTLQDSMMPVEVGDAELRAQLADVRELIGHVGDRADRFLRTLGR
jgi:hypothetical protein